LETYISYLSGGRIRYEKLNHEISVLKKLKYHLLAAIRLMWPILPCHERGV
jgi:hypothetical protein